MENNRFYENRKEIKELAEANGVDVRTGLDLYAQKMGYDDEHMSADELKPILKEQNDFVDYLTENRGDLAAALQ